MGKMHDMMERLTVTAKSPDRTVTITASGTPASIEVELARGSLAGHTDASLERQIEAAARVAYMAYRKGAHTAWATAANVDRDA
ncbi:MAG: hypothetical protein WCA46_10185 [Actinocatenispora sp.]